MRFLRNGQLKVTRYALHSKEEKIITIDTSANSMYEVLQLVCVLNKDCKDFGVYYLTQTQLEELLDNGLI